MTQLPQNSSKSLKIVGFFAREHGLAGLRRLLESPHQVVAVATHRRIPKSEDLMRSERSEFAEFTALASAKGFSLYTVDSKEEQNQLNHILQSLDFDILAAISWRRLIPLATLTRAQKGTVNLHRGRLPDYAGAEPIKHALMHGDRTIAITAHVIDEQIDHGPKLCIYEHAVNYIDKASLEENVDRLKHELTPHFGPLLLQAIDMLVSAHPHSSE